MPRPALLIDMDDTLYPEISYVASGFQAVAAAVAARGGGEPADYAAFMLQALRTEGRGKIFDGLLAHFSILRDCVAVAELVEIYRSHNPAIELFPGVEAALKDLQSAYRLAIVTDGLAAMQRQKVTALGLANIVDCIVYCWDEDAPKPESRAYRRALAQLEVEVEQAIIIGDRPDHDIQAALSLGCRAIRIRGGAHDAVPTPKNPLVLGETSRFADIGALLP